MGNLITVFCLLVSSFTLLFPAGILRSDSPIESTADYLANVARDYTTGGKYVALSIKNNGVSEKNVNDSVSEFTYLYGRFGEQYATYASAMNSNKKLDVYIKEISKKRYSFLHNDHGFGSVSYKGHYKQATYPLELMFSGEHLPVEKRETLPNSTDKYTSFIYLGENDAKELLPVKGIEYDDENPQKSFEKLMGKYVTVNIEGNDFYYWIENIYLETNYFYDALTEVMGNFLFCAGYPRGTFKKEAMFFLRNHTYQNRYFIDYAISSYSLNDFDYNILDFNFVDNFSLNESNVCFVEKGNNALSTTLIIISILVFGLTIISILFYRGSITWYRHLIIAGGWIFPYILFFTFYKITKNPLLFNSFSTLWYLSMSIIFFIIYIILIVAKFEKSKTDA